MTSYVNGYSVSPDRARIGVKTYKVKDGVFLPVRASVAPLLIPAAKAYDRMVEPLHPGWCWGYNFRAITGGSGYSWHAAGIAEDLNAPLHPYGVDPHRNYTEDQLRTLRAIAAYYGLRSGVDYHTNPDGMHLEVIDTPAQARARIARIRAGAAGPILPFPKIDLSIGSSGYEVRMLQHALNTRPLPLGDVKVDGKFGPKTEALVRQFKHRQGLQENGIVGHGAWDRLF